MPSHSHHSTSPNSLGDRLLFFATFLRAPLSMGSVTPSFRAVGERMRRIIEERADGPLAVIEFGSGTGAVTRAFEGYETIGLDLDEGLLEHARRNCPFARFQVGNVCDPDFQLPDFKSPQAFLVSCIPAVNLGERRSDFERNLQRFLENPRVLGLLQYTYLPKPPIDIEGLPRRRDLVLRNIPPAFIYSWIKPRDKEERS